MRYTVHTVADYEYLASKIVAAVTPGLPPPTWDMPERHAAILCQAVCDTTAMTPGVWSKLTKAERVTYMGETIKVLDWENSTLTENEETVLRFLQMRKPRLAQIAEIIADTDIAERTCKKVVSQLISLGLAHRPQGERSGVTITRDGKKYLARIDQT